MARAFSLVMVHNPRMRRLAPIAVALAVAACGGSPTTPAPVGSAPILQLVAPFEGVWNFKYRADQCEGERHCFAVLGQTYDFSVRLVGTASGYEGVVLLPGANVDVTGTIDASGALLLSGVRPRIYANDFEREVEVTRLRLASDGSAVTGDLEYKTRGEWNGWFGTESRRNGPIVAATRLADSTSTSLDDFNGIWSGRVATRDCSSVGWQGCFPLEARELWDFELTVTGTGSRVSGLFRRPTAATVEGNVSGASMILQGAGDSRGSGHTGVTTIRPSTLTRDRVGRMKGSLSIEMRWLWNDGRVSSTDFRVIELIDVVLRPPS